MHWLYIKFKHGENDNIKFDSFDEARFALALMSKLETIDYMYIVDDHNNVVHDTRWKVSK